MISERLRRLRNEKGCTKKHLVENLPLNYSTYANYESGIREPSFEVLQKIADFYKVSTDYLLGTTDNRKRIDDVFSVTEAEYDHIKSYRRLDKHGKRLVDSVLRLENERASKKRIGLQVFSQSVSAGFGNYLGEYSDTDYEVLKFYEDAVSSQADFAVRLSGNSMEPKYFDGDIVCIKSGGQVDPGQIGIFIYDGESYCKMLMIDRNEGKIYLESLNKSYAPIYIRQPEQLKTVGLVLGVSMLDNAV